ncbi:chitin-inducible gibberellin-responsive protein 1-like [Salvia hispanica]|uniref:chitin-inducible gibberellin-responsive protein 1-like n=1 Tax=Salvia hispanica TaxID=49212 RepID=UPI0020093568|nr:chitin-inducible gibberellin-responsive protein 1-like [Salvia hispanica]
MGSGYHGYSEADLSSYSSYPTVSSIPTRLFESLKFDSRSSPNSPFASLFEADSVATVYSDSQERFSPSGYLSEATHSSDSSVDYSVNLHHSRPFPTGHQESPSAASAFHSNASSNRSIEHALLELESVLMDEEVVKSEPCLGGNSYRQSQTPEQRVGSWQEEAQGSRSYVSGSPRDSWMAASVNDGVYAENRMGGAMEDFALQGFPPNDLKGLLMACARALHENRLEDFEKLVERARGAVSITGEPIQRLGAYLVEGLVARRESSGTNIYRALKCNEPESKDLLSYMHILYEICPYLKFGYMAANGAIAEACKNEDRIHIIDFQISQGTQWMTLLQALAARPSGPPHVRITGIDDPVSKHARGDGLSAVERRLAAISEKFNIPVEFHAVPVFAPDITKEMLDVRPGEGLAVNFPLQLHHTPDESVDVSNPRDGLLRMVRSLNPKVVTLVEQESNTNTASFPTRFKETLDYYSAMFESIDVTMPRDRRERINVEQQCLARDIVNIVACEGRERVERHELFGKWRLRFTMAGFRQYPLSSYVNSVIRGLLRCYSEHYTLVEKDGAMLLGWKDRNLVSASAWH